MSCSNAVANFIKLRQMSEMFQRMSTEDRNEYFFENLVTGTSGGIGTPAGETLRSLVGQYDPTFLDVCKGHEYRDGSRQVKRNYEKAAESYRKAAMNGNAEGMYNLALLTAKGQGVKKDYKTAHDLLKQAAEMPPMRTVGETEIPNVGVAVAEFCLGSMCREGVGVLKSYVVAVYWYKRAVQHGSCSAANSLGLMCMNGEGMEEIDYEMAEDLFLLSYRQGDGNGALGLVDLYLIRNDPDRAVMWHERSLNHGSSRLQALIRDSEFRKLVEQVRKAQSELNRQAAEGERPKVDYDRVAKAMHTLMREPRNQVNYPKDFDPDMLEKYAMNGSKTAMRMLEAMSMSDQAFAMLMDTDNKEDCTDYAVHLLAKAVCLEEIVCTITQSGYDNALATVERILSRNVTDEPDRDARVVYAFLKSTKDMRATVKFLQASLQRYPDDFDLLSLLSCVSGFTPEYAQGLSAIDRALQLEPDNYDVMNCRARALQSFGRYDEARKQYEQFLARAPPDNRNVPESHYGIAHCLLLSANKQDCKSKALVDAVDEQFKRGLKSEEDQLPCFLPFKAGKNKEACSLWLLEFQKGPLAVVNKQENSSRSKRLTCPHRVELIRNHREFINKMKNIKSGYQTKLSIQPEKQQHATALSQCKEIELRDMDFTVDHVLNGRVLHVTQIDIPCFGLQSMVLIVEDINKHVQRMSIYGLGEDYKRLGEKFAVGTRFAIVNPYVRLATDGKPAIRVDDPSSVIIHAENRVQHMCRFCGRAESKSQCGKCKVAKYCSKECQTDDWKLLGHKLVCE